PGLPGRLQPAQHHRQHPLRRRPDRELPALPRRRGRAPQLRALRAADEPAVPPPAQRQAAVRHPARRSLRAERGVARGGAPDGGRRAVSRPQILMVGPTLAAKGGMASVVEEYRRAGLFERWGIRYVATTEEGSRAEKLAAAARAWSTIAGTLLRDR